MMRRTAVSILSLLVWASLSAAGSTAYAAGSWVAQTRLPTLRQRGWRYATARLEPRPTTPLAGRGITRISWRYHYRDGLPGLQVALCGGGRCIDASPARGSSRAFVSLPVTTTFRFYVRIDGRGVLAEPVHGRQAQLVVNFK